MNRITIFIIAAIVIILWLSWVFQSYLLSYVEVTWSQEHLGQWGDTFGALNALFAAIAFLAVLYTIKLQQSQINKSQADQSKQKFERYFFQLLQLLREERIAINYPKNSMHYTFANAERILNNNIISKTTLDKSISKQNLIEIYEQNIDDFAGNLFSPYYRLIYTILKFIHDEDSIDENEKSRFGNLVRDQLSNPEIAVIMVAGLRPVASDMSKYLIEFRIARYLNSGPIKTSLELYYPKETFQARND